MSQSQRPHDQVRGGRLRKVFNTFIQGRRPVSSTIDARLFLEAVIAEEYPSSALEKILSSPLGLHAVRQSVRMSATQQFVCERVMPFIAYISQTDTMAIGDGKLFRQIICALVVPPTAWQAIVRLYMTDTFLDKSASNETFAWLCYQLVAHPNSDWAIAADDIANMTQSRSFLDSDHEKVREYGYQIRKIIEMRTTPNGMLPGFEGIDGPGGRHDNDFADFRQISIYPTPDELVSSQRPFYRQAVEVADWEAKSRAGIHLDNQFRLLREDMLADLREDVQAALQKGNKAQRGFQMLQQLRPLRIDTGNEKRGRQCTLMVSVGSDSSIPRHGTAEQRTDFLASNPQILRHRSFGALYMENQVIGFAFVIRIVAELVRDPPVVGLEFTSSDVLVRALVALQSERQVNFVLVDTPVFAYQPVLERLQDVVELPLHEELLKLDEGHGPRAERACELGTSLSDIFKTGCADSEPYKTLSIGGKAFQLDEAQFEALTHILGRRLSIVQGPPGTGKSFIGAIAAKALLETTSARLLVLSYTNHALDQFLEDLLDIGIEPGVMTRLGSKYSASTEQLSFESQFRQSDRHMTRATHLMIDKLQEDAKALRECINEKLRLVTAKISLEDLLDYLEFCEDEEAALMSRAFHVSVTEDGFTTVGSRGSQVNRDYLLSRWIKGSDAGLFSARVPAECQATWGLPHQARKDRSESWVTAIQNERASGLSEAIDRFDMNQAQIDMLFSKAKFSFVQGKRVIGCTTTAAANYSSLIKAAKLDCVLVEEAGEILEAHILAALNPDVRKLILIGDHQQLRPKCQSYTLSVEKGDGFDLNKSLFERLIMQGNPYKVLKKQHRMDPEISQLIRSMTYPELLDDEKTFGRCPIRGLRCKFVFMNHEHLEEEEQRKLQVRVDGGQRFSKENRFEAQMVLKLIKYLGQQGYGTEDIVVLTPYLGQLRLLRDMLSQDSDPILGDLDSHDLVRAGLMSSGASKVQKRKIRLSTIDNFQGEESKIVIASLTRGNKNGDIGFMKDPERLNVLLSRARDCLVMLGNMETFLASRASRGRWCEFFELLKSRGLIHDELTIRCEQHPERTVTLATPRDFEVKCPDGGCSEMCGAKLSCGLHSCERRCHRILDHGKMVCRETISKTCDKQHEYSVSCNNAQTGCPDCQREEEKVRRRAQQNLEIEKARLKRQEAYRAQLEEIEDEIAHQRRLLKEDRILQDQERVLKQRQSELHDLTQRNDQRSKREELAKKLAKHKQDQNKDQDQDQAQDTLDEGDMRGARAEWHRMKRDELAQSDTMDTLMNMIGLEAVKACFLDIKTQVDTLVRQGVTTANERFGCTLLGNPGTGKTTVARLYAKFLTSAGVVGGSCYKETTGSKLANGGVAACQNLIDEVLSEGGGVIFIDEAYQLSSGNNPGGPAVMDFLLAEAENQRSRICFVLAGYAKQMETFFAHNPGLPSRFPLTMKFEDYTDDELLRILELKIETKYNGNMKVEDGPRGLYSRIVARRLGRGRGQEGFGNARAVENVLAEISRRQSRRLRRERQARMRPDDLLFKKDDMIGPEPSNALEDSGAWSRLKALIGLAAVKTSVESLLETVRTNYQRELDEEPIIEYSLNRVFLGNPGTGKTTVAKLYGQILVDLGMLSSGEVIIKNPSDFVGSHMGHSEQQTKGILAATAGKVLVIDEAYGLYDGSASQGGSGRSNSFKTAVVDTIVSTVHSTPGDDRCVLLLGYREQMEEMLQNVNPGLSRRFPLQSAFKFADFDRAELADILDLKLGQQKFSATKAAKQVALDMLDRARNRPHFGNAGEVDSLLSEAKSRHQSRLVAKKTKRTSTLESPDFDEDYERLDRSGTDVAQLFMGTVGCERLVALLQGYQQICKKTAMLGMDPKDNIPFNFLFRGPPGTGKSTTARKMGKIFYDAGLLSDAQVLDCSASDLVGQFVGQTGPKVRQLLDKALGRVLLIDEAYRLVDGTFGKEALDELVDAITKDKYYKRLIIILVGYEEHINSLLAVNPGLSSRFPDVIDFRGLDAGECSDLLVTKLQQQKSFLEKQGKGVLDLSCFEQPDAGLCTEMRDSFDVLSSMPGWASARDVETLARAVFQKSLDSVAEAGDDAVLTVSEALVMEEMAKMTRERRNRASSGRPGPKNLHPSEYLKSLFQAQSLPSEASSPTTTAPTSEIAIQHNSQDKNLVEDAATVHLPTLEPVADAEGRGGGNAAKRDSGVSDRVWNQLQKDAEAQAQRDRDYQAKLKQKRETADSALRERIVKELIEEERQRKEAAERKKKLQGRCPMGYDWIEQNRGWRCAGGSHFVSHGELQ